MTQFEQALQQVKEQQLQTPKVMTEGREIDYFGYQLSVHHFNLKLMAKGMTCRGIKFSDIKRYYGLKGRTASDCLPQFEVILNDYKTNFINSNN
jgi:hypothetical protein